MTLSDLSIRKPVFAWMLMAALLVFGGIGGARLGVSKMPDVDFPQVSVSVNYEGAAPDVVETDVIEILEDACSSVEGVTRISSTSRQGSARLDLDFEIGRDIDAALQDVQTRIAQAQRRLPDDIDPPTVSKQNPEDDAILWVSVAGPRPPQYLSDLARYTLKERFQTVPGVGEIQLGGHRARNLRVWIDGERLDALDLTVSDVLDALQREHVELPAGRIETASLEVSVRTQGEAMDLEEMRGLVVAERSGAQVLLRDVALVEDGLEDNRRLSRLDGYPAQGVGIRKQRGANAVAVAHAVRDRMEEIRRDLPEDVVLAVTFDSTRSVEEAVHEILWTLLHAVIFTALVIWLFLGSISSTINVLLAIPTSIVGTFGVMYFLGFTLNTFTLLGLSLAVGIVVDDAIMVLENIFRRAEEGEPRIRASVTGARQIAFAAMAATAAIVAIFLPVAFMKGIIGRFFFQFGVTISVAVLLSLLEALTLTPSRCAQFLSVEPRSTRFGRGVDAAFHAMARAYGRSLRPTLRLWWLVLPVAGAGFVASLLLLPMLRTELTPPQDVDVFRVRLKTPVGSSMEATDASVRRCEEILRARPEVERVYSVVGGFGGGEVNSGFLMVTLVSAASRTVTVQEFMADVRKSFAGVPGLSGIFQDVSTEGLTSRRGSAIEFTVQGPEWDRLADLSARMMAEMERAGPYVDINTDHQAGVPEIRVVPDRARAAAMGVSVRDISRTVNAMVGGVQAGKFTDRGRRYDVRVRLLAAQRTSADDIGRLRVRTRTGELVPLSTLVRLEERPSLQQITRRDRERSIGVTANIAAGASQGTAIEEIGRIADRVLPEGYRVRLSGSTEAFGEARWELGFALILGIIVAYMILAAQFNSFLHPVSVLAALPFSVSGALLALWAFDLTINLYSFIGVILLMGIVKKNSILLVDFTNQRRVLGDSRDEALLHACPERLRPILMTTLSTLAGALPAALASGAGSELRRPMAWAVIGGTAVSTVLTLYVVPALYAVLDRLTPGSGGAAATERETLAVLADLEAEHVERFRHREPATAEAPPG